MIFLGHHEYHLDYVTDGGRDQTKIDDAGYVSQLQVFLHAKMCEHIYNRTKAAVPMSRLFVKKVA